ncbi:MAG: hypothetical protein JST28_01245 [Acidobacteria bacterium]|nr:hypothetical protein [Acidobacteriota bacterium]
MAKSSYDIIISGGGFYEFDRDRSSKRTWACKGEARLLHLSKPGRRRFEIVDESQIIAKFSKDWGFADYTILLLNETEWKLVVCIVLALSLSQSQSAYIVY